jgi:nitroreductase
MTSTTKPNSAEAIYASLGGNERAVIDRVNPLWLRRFFIHLVATKMQLQFTGWLQYLIPVPITLGLLLVVGLLYLVGLPSVAAVLLWLPLGLIALILFDIVTCRLRIRLPEALPKAQAQNDVFTLMRNRRSCRSYQKRALTAEHTKALQASIHSHMIEPKLGSTPIRLEWVEAPITVWPVVNARQFLVAIAPAKYDRTAILDIGHTLQKIVIDATRLGLGTCWIGPGADHLSVKAHLGDRFDEQRDAIICLCAIGYKSWYAPTFIRLFNANMQHRLPLAELVMADETLQRPLVTDAKPWAEFARCFESCQWAPSSYNGQTTRAVAKQTEQGVRLDFYAATASRYYAAVATGIWLANWQMGCDALGKKGHFVHLDLQARALTVDEEPPHYEISWLSSEVQ